MAVPEGEVQERNLVLESDDVRRALDRIAHEIIEHNKGVESLVLLGIQQGGIPLAQRLAARLEAFTSVEVPWSSLDVTPYRDDLRLEGTRVSPGDIWMADLTKQHVILVDDVMYTGRTIAAALRALGEYGRPSSIQLAVLVDRGHREMPFEPDYVGKNLPTNRLEHVEANLKGVAISRRPA